MGTILRWTGRLFILLAVFILVSAFFLPSAVQPLNPVVCPEGTELSNHRFGSRNGPDNAPLELVCTSAQHSESAAQKVLLVTVGLVTLGLISLYFAQRLQRPKFHRPDTPVLH